MNDGMLEIAGFVGAGLGGAAYLPQIWHLVRVRCSGGISRPAFCVWLLASALVLPHAVATGATVFVVLAGVQILAIGFILVYAWRVPSSPCSGHAHAPGRARERPPVTLPRSRVGTRAVDFTSPARAPVRRMSEIGAHDPTGGDV